MQVQRFNEEKIIRAEREPFLDGRRIFPLSGDLFVHDAIILERLRSPFLTVCDPTHGRRVRVDFGGAPFLGLWARPNTPYICIEPWYGVDDDVFQTGAIEEKKGVVRLGGQDMFRFVCSITPQDAASVVKRRRHLPARTGIYYGGEGVNHSTRKDGFCCENLSMLSPM